MPESINRITNEKIKRNNTSTCTLIYNIKLINGLPKRIFA